MTIRNPRVYLDNCCFNRPFDNQSLITIKFETEAKLFIQDLIKNQHIDIIWSFMLDYENNVNPYKNRKEWIYNWESYAKDYIILDKEVYKYKKST